MKQKRHTTEEIIRVLRKADGEQTVEAVCRECNVSEQTFYRWRRKYGRMEQGCHKWWTLLGSNQRPVPCVPATQ